ncbi:M15 family metallopeptidase [Pseudonocardia sp. GCM10023141]|uniref:M15 family metallopeptidase n=1 Tax=Pseudonocardia sp. GCM10023141 TaxID=3252653 RepID=UPI00360D9C3E
MQNDSAGPGSSEIVLMADPLVVAVSVRDNGERLLDVRECDTLVVSALMADGDGAYAKARSGVVERLVRAGEALPTGLRLMIFEGFRPPPLQRQIFDGYRDSLRRANPDWDDHRLRMAASRYVSPPELAPHSAGAAIDLTLCTDDGVELDLGTPVNATPEQSDGACYTGHLEIGDHARRNRALMGTALQTAGFVNYPTEWWHWSYGDRYWALATNAPEAIYGSYPDQL